MKRNAFTLIEVLVVAAIIALLAGILMPSLSKAKAQARRVTCASQLHQVGLAMVAYMHDSKDRMPWASLMPSVDKAPCKNKTIYFADVMNPHLKGAAKEALHCPDDRVNGHEWLVERTGTNAGKTYFETERSSYEYRVELAELSPKEFNQPPVYIPRTVAEHWHHGRDVNRKVAPDTIWFARDYDNFHGKRGEMGARRYVYVDGHVADYEN